MSSSESWPKAEAERAKLYIPSSYEPYQESEPSKCFLRFDDDKKMLMLVSETTGETLDVINPEDIIGAAIEVELLGKSENPRSVKNTSTFKNSESRTEEDDNAVSLDCGIFKPLAQDEENIFSSFNNEPTTDIPFDTQAAAVLNIYVYPRTDLSKQSLLSSCGFKRPETKTAAPIVDPSKLGPRQANHRKFQVAPAEDFSNVSAVVRGIRKLCQTNPEGERLLVVVNPFSGTAKGEEVYKTIVSPMLEQADIDHDLLITTHARHAEERVKVQPKDSDIIDLAKYDGIVAIGGDGMVHEILQGIHSRSDCMILLKRLKLGHIGAGTSNGLSKSLVHASEENHNTIDYAFMVAKGRTFTTDLSLYETKCSSYLSFLTFTWSIIADIDIESEAIRFLGFLRMDVWAVWRVLNLRTYRAKFSYLPPSEKASNTKLPPLSQSIPSDSSWVTSEDDFILFWASQVTHAAENTYMTPQCRLDDGVFVVFIVR